MRPITLVLSALFLVLGTHAVTKADPPAAVARWEYKMVSAKMTGRAEPSEGQVLTALLASSGGEGFELCGVSGGWFILKRPGR